MSRPLALIVEDEQMLAEIFSTALQMAGFATESILNGRAAVERLAEITPVLVLLDLHLPGVPGPDILRRIRADERLSHTRVIIVSADAAKAESLREEADAIQLKPLGVIQLRNLAARFLPADESSSPDS
ncbi:MAG: response regulator [Anaerolineae bacterium]|nr:response regulator [Anaerolineae bacterium]MCB0224249.1 response regulator [Anaerolineae bacterium]MCB9102810.1 response regulator [Anaerolineales bacterium]